MALLEGQKTTWCQRRTVRRRSQAKAAWQASVRGCYTWCQRRTDCRRSQAKAAWQASVRGCYTWCQRSTARCRSQAKAAWLCLNDKKSYLVPTKDGALQVPGEGDMALLEGQKKLHGANGGWPTPYPEDSMAQLEVQKTTWCQ